MNIAKALKVKNRLVSEISRLQDIFRRENSRRDDSQSQVDLLKIETELFEARNKLIRLKGALNRASAPISESLAELAERKTQILFLKGLPTRVGVETVAYGNEKKEYNWSSFYSREIVDEKVKAVQVAIDELQDKIDCFNARTKVEYNDCNEGCDKECFPCVGNLFGTGDVSSLALQPQAVQSYISNTADQVVTVTPEMIEKARRELYNAASILNAPKQVSETVETPINSGNGGDGKNGLNLETVVGEGIFAQVILETPVQVNVPSEVVSDATLEALVVPVETTPEVVLEASDDVLETSEVVVDTSAAPEAPSGLDEKQQKEFENEMRALIKRYDANRFWKV